jgi:hypothetical protein
MCGSMQARPPCSAASFPREAGKNIGRRALLAGAGALAAIPARAAEKTRVTLWHAISAQ